MFELFSAFFTRRRIEARFSSTRGLIYITGSSHVYVFLLAVGSDGRSLFDCRRAGVGDSLQRNVLKESDRILSERRFLRRALVGFAQAAVTAACCDPELCSPGQAGDDRGGGEHICSVTVGEKGGNLAARVIRQSPSSFGRRLCCHLPG